MLKMFRYQVFRRKLLGAVAGTLCIAIFIAVGTYFLLRSGWIGKAHDQSIQQGGFIEANIRTEDDLLTLQIVNAYASAPLIDDILRLFSSRTFDEYLAARLMDSRAQDALIRSFPDYLRSYLRQYRSALYTIIIHGDGFTHRIAFGSGEIEYAFDTGNAQVPLQDGFTLRRTLYNPSHNYQEIGDISFVFHTEGIVRGAEFADFPVAILLDDNGSALSLNHRALPDLSSLRGDVFAQEYGHYGYRLITTMDDRTLIRANFVTVLSLIVVMILFTLVSTSIFVTNIRYDAIFVEDIFTMIHSIEQGIFDVKPVNVRYQGNEYGRIARELRNMSLQLKQYIQSEYELKIKQQQTEMHMLQNQINPHFLYNTLEAISAQALINDDPSTADAIAALGSLFREMVSLPSHITLKDEVRLLETYLRIMECKCAGNFSYQVELAPNLEAFHTIKFWLQPLAENFFYHGFDAQSHYNVLIVRCYTQDDTVCIDIMDNGQHLSPDQLSAVNSGLRLPDGADGSIGLRNVYHRLVLFYNDRVTLTIANHDQRGIINRIRIQRGDQNV